MTDSFLKLAGAVHLAPHVTLTRLPYGGAVMVDGVTLALVECGEPQAEFIDRLLTHGIPDPDPGPDASASPDVRLTQDLLEGGWLVLPRRAKGEDR